MKRIFNYQISACVIIVLFLSGLLYLGLPVKAMNSINSGLPTTQLSIQQIEASDHSSFLIENDGSLWAWGNNGDGQLGDGTTVDKSTPIKVMENVVSVSASYKHTLAIKTDGSLWAWGWNGSGTLGDGTTINKSTPLKVMGNVVSVSVGDTHTLVIKTDGSLWAWGSNVYGQLGDGTTIDKSTPIKVMDNVVSVSAGWIYTLAIKNDKSLWAWGSNVYGQLGDGTVINKLTPIKVMDNVKSISGSLHTLAIKTDGGLWSWGNNYRGQLGDGTTTNKLVPNKVMDNVVSVSAGVFHTLAIKTDGSLWAWGWNGWGQLGDGTVTSRNIPVKILSSQFFYDCNSLNSFYLPIFDGAPSIYLTYNSDLNAKFSIAYDETPGNFSLVADHQIIASQNGNATILITDSTGSIIYKTINFVSYIDKLQVSSNVPNTSLLSHSIFLVIKNSVSSFLNGQSFLGGLVSQEGNYILSTTDVGGFEYITTFQIDLTSPIITIDTYSTDLTNQNITVTAITNEGTLNQSSYTFTQNGSFNFIASDSAGNISTQTVILTISIKTLQ